MSKANNYIQDNLPKGWMFEKISNVILPSSTINPIAQPNKRFTYFDISSINNKSFLIEDPKEIYGKDAPSRAKKTVNKDSILFATTRPNLKNIAIVKDELTNPVASTGFCVLNADSKKILTNFLFYFLITDEIQQQIEPLIRGAQYPAISDKDLLSIQIPLPPLPEQQRIVKKLDSLFERLDKAIALTEENLEHCRHLLPAALNEVFLLKNVNVQTVSLMKYVEFIGGSQPAKEEFIYEDKDGYVRLIQIRDYKSDTHKVYIKKENARRFCEEDDIMIGRYGPPVFQILRGLKGAYNVALMKAVPNEKYITKDYLFWFLQNPDIQNYIIGISQRSAGQSGVNKDALEKYEILMPTLHIQHKIVSYLNQLTAKQQTLQQHYTKQLQHLQALKASLLDAAFRGEL